MINLALTPTDAALVLAALRNSAQDINAPQIDALIDIVQYKINLAEREADAEESDLFRSDAEADAERCREDCEPIHDYHKPWGG